MSQRKGRALKGRCYICGCAQKSGWRNETMCWECYNKAQTAKPKPQISAGDALEIQIRAKEAK